MLILRVALLMVGAMMLAASVVVLVRNKSLDTELLATIAAAGAICVMVVALVLKNGK